MEETTKTSVNENQKETNQQGEETKSTENKPLTEEEMAVKIAEEETKEKKAEAENQKLQNKNNALSSENAEQKRIIRASKSAEEQKAEEEEEARRLLSEENKEMREKLNHITAVAAYKNIPDENTVESLIEAISESDHNAIAAIIENEKAKAVKEAKAEWQKSIPQPQFGTGEYSFMSKKEIMAIKDTAERQKAILANRQLFGI